MVITGVQEVPPQMRHCAALEAPSRGSEAAASSYVTGLALMRFLSVIAVIWTHASAHLASVGLFNPALAGRFGSAFFTQCAVFLTLEKAMRPSTALGFSTYARRRFFRIYIPFVTWSAIYVALKFLSSRFFHAPKAHVGLSFFWNGGEYHLWFLPFILVVGMAVFLMGRRLSQCSQRARLAVAAGSLIAGAVVCAFPFHVSGEDFRSDYLLVLAWNRTPSVLAGIAITCVWQRYGARFFQHGAWGVAGVLIMVLSLMAVAHDVITTWAEWENLAGVGAMLFALWLGNRFRLPGARAMAGLTYGIYLCHVIFVGACRNIAKQHNGDTSIHFAILTTFIAVAASCTLAWALHNNRRLRWLVPA